MHFVLFDLQRDTLFSSELDEDMIDIIDFDETATEIVSDGIEEKCNKLDVEPELQLSLLLGMVELSGSGAFLAEERKSARSQSLSLVYKQKTVKEEITMRENKRQIDTNVLQTTNATHAVVAIDWGAICSIMCEYDNISNEDATVVESALSEEIENLEHLIVEVESVETFHEDKDMDQQNKFTFRCKTDVPSHDVNIATFEGAVEFARSLPSIVEDTNYGKGVPLRYHLMPLETIITKCRFKINRDVQYIGINEGTAQQCKDILDKLTESRKTIYDIRHNMRVNDNFIPERSISIDDIWEKHMIQESLFRDNLSNLVKGIRSGSDDISVLDKFVSEQSDEVIPTSKKYNDSLLEFKKDINKAKSIKILRDEGIIYLGKNDQLITNEKANVFVLYKTDNDEDSHDLDKNFSMRIAVTYGKNDSIFYVIDPKISAQFCKIDRALIHHYCRGILKSVDLYSEIGRDLDMCLIQIGEPAKVHILPDKRAYVQLKCPNTVASMGKCTGSNFFWKCSKCKQLVEYGIEDHMFYCTCGRSEPVNSRFRCDSTNHGVHFVSYPCDELRSELSNLRAIKDINILLLGETGVGKSTWINAFQNYLYFDDLNEAMKSPDLIFLIPTAFTFTQDGRPKKVSIGEQDDNELLEDGTSATKQPRSYVFYDGGRESI